ncbi:hypothetical protein HDU98_000813, partial [Podochytrium sp. JEL0797]
MNFLEIKIGVPSHVAATCAAVPPLAPGSIRVQIDKFGLTANNITYVATGETFQYNKFFPTGTPTKTHMMPVWGLATVIETLHPQVAKGCRLYGYFPAASNVDLTPNTVGKTSFKVLRPQLPADRSAYNQYEFCTTDPFHSANSENAMILFRPLWFTSYLLSDYITFNKTFGADTIVISSASSKTSFCLAQIATRAGVNVVGLTSPRNLAWTKSLGVYTSLVLYDQMEGAVELKGKRIVYVDVAGDPELMRNLISVVKANG